MEQVADVGVAGAVREDADERGGILVCDQEGADALFVDGIAASFAVTARLDLEVEAETADVHRAEDATVAVHAAETVLEQDELFLCHFPFDARGHRVLLDKLDHLFAGAVRGGFVVRNAVIVGIDDLHCGLCDVAVQGERFDCDHGRSVAVNFRLDGELAVLEDNSRALDDVGAVDSADGFLHAGNCGVDCLDCFAHGIEHVKSPFDSPGM